MNDNYILYGYITIIIVALIPAFRSWANLFYIIMPKQWLYLQDKINSLTIDDIKPFPAHIHDLLSRVLTSRPGIGKIHAVPAALEHFGERLDFYLRVVRSCSYLVVLLGLLATVFTLYITFSNIKDINDITKIKLGHLPYIYKLNAIAIFFAAVVYFSYIVLGFRCQWCFLLASQALSRLQPEILEGADPRLVAALEGVGRKFSDWGEEIYTRHQQNYERLTREMQNLGAAIRDMLQEMVKFHRSEQEGLLPLLRSQEEKIELLSQRLDERFRDLARPLLEAVPRLEEWRQQTEELKGVLQDLRQADLPGRTMGLTQAVSSLTSTVEGLPGAVRRHFEGIKEVLGEGLRQALRQGWQETMMPELSRLTSQLASVRDLLQVLKDSVQHLPGVVSERVAEKMAAAWRETIPAFTALRQHLDRLLEAHQALERLMEHLPNQVGKGVLAGFHPLVEQKRELVAKLDNLGEQTARLSRLIQSLPQAVQGGLEEMRTALSDTVTSLQEILRQPRPPEEATLNLLQKLLEKHQEQLQASETLQSWLASRWEAWEARAAEKTAEGLRLALTTTGDGYFRELIKSLSDLEETLKKCSLSPGALPSPVLDS